MGLFKDMQGFFSGKSSSESLSRDRPRRLPPGSIPGTIETDMNSILRQLKRCIREYEYQLKVGDELRQQIENQPQKTSDANDESDVSLQEFIQDARGRATRDTIKDLRDKLGIEGDDDLGKQENYAQFLEGDNPEEALEAYKEELQENLVNKFHQHLGLSEPTVKSAYKM